MKNIGFIGVFVLVAAGTAQADPRDDALGAMRRCSGISDKPQRLACYDTSVAGIPGVRNNAAPVAPQHEHDSSFADRLFGPDGARRAAQTTVAEFGSESIANGGRDAYPTPIEGDTIDQISARLVNYQFVDGYIVVTLDNGQMWHETADGQPLQHLAGAALSYTAIIGRGGDGSYAMKLSGVAREVSVRRIR